MIVTDQCTMEPRPRDGRVTSVKDAADHEMGLLYEACAPRLLRLLTAMGGSTSDAEDVLQEAFARLIPRWRHIRRYDDPEAWIRQVAIRLLISKARRRRTADHWLQRQSAPRSAHMPDQDQIIDLREAMAMLPLKQRAVLVLHYGLDLPVAQIATELGISIGTVKSRLSRGRQSLSLTLAVLPQEEGAS